MKFLPLLTLMALASPVAALADGNLATDFSSLNPSGEWSFGWTDGTGETFNAYDLFTYEGGVATWKSSALADSPSISKTDGADRVSLLNGAGGELSVARWTSTWSGVVLIDALFFSTDASGPVHGYTQYDHFGVAVNLMDETSSNPTGNLLFGTGLTINEGSFVDFWHYNVPAVDLRADMSMPVPDGGSTGLLTALVLLPLLALRRRLG